MAEKDWQVLLEIQHAKKSKAVVLKIAAYLGLLVHFDLCAIHKMGLT